MVLKERTKEQEFTTYQELSQDEKKRWGDPTGYTNRGAAPILQTSLLHTGR